MYKIIATHPINNFESSDYEKEETARILYNVMVETTKSVGVNNVVIILLKDEEEIDRFEIESDWKI